MRPYVSKKYYIGVDMDGVLYPFDEAFNDLSENYGGPRHDFTSWVNFSEVYGDGIVDKIWNDPTLFDSKDPYPGAIKGLEALYSIPNVQVLIITNPGRNPELAVPAKWNWIKRHAPFVHYYDFCTMHKKWLMNLDMIVEDSHDNLLACIKRHPDPRKYQAVLIDRKWNQKYQEKLLKRGAYVVEGIEHVSPLVTLFTNLKEKNNG